MANEAGEGTEYGPAQRREGGGRRADGERRHLRGRREGAQALRRQEEARHRRDGVIYPPYLGVSWACGKAGGLTLNDHDEVEHETCVDCRVRWCLECWLVLGLALLRPL